MAITVALHVLVFAAVLIYYTHVRPERQETILILPITTFRPPATEHVHAKPPLQRGAKEAHTPFAIPSPDTTIFTAPSHALHGLLFDCTPDRILTPEDRRRCESIAGAPKPDDAAGLRNPPERTHDAAQWARAVARKKAPALLPCANPQGVDFVYTALCLGKSALQGGFGDLDAQPGYADKPESFHLPNNGDPQRPRQPPY